MTVELEVIEAPGKRGLVVIRSGPYDIRFAPDEKGNAKKAGFTYWGQRLESISIPKEFFLPALVRANAIFHDRRKRRQKKV